MNFFYLSWRPVAVFAIEPLVHDIRVIQFEAACAAYAEFREKVSQFEPVDWGFLERRIDSIAVAERTDGLFLFEMRFRDSVRADEVAEECAAKVSFLIRSRRGHIHSAIYPPFRGNRPSSCLQFKRTGRSAFLSGCSQMICWPLWSLAFLSAPKSTSPFSTVWMLSES